MFRLRCLPRWLLVLISCFGICFLAVIIQSKYVRTVTCKVDEREDSLAGQVVIVTGASSGIGFQIALEMARRGARVVLGCRHPVEGQAARQYIVTKTGSTSVAVVGLDLADMRKVHKFYDKIVELYGKVDVLVNNAATGKISTTRKLTSQGLEKTMATNHLGPMYLTKLLVPLLTPKGNVITITCKDNLDSDIIDADDLNSVNNYDPTKLYHKTKLLNIMMARYIKNLLKHGQSSYTVDPGVTWTNLYADLHDHMHHDDTATRLSTGQHGLLGWIRWLVGPVMHGAACPTLAWHDAVWLATGGSETDDLTSGGHFSNCKTADHLVNKQADDTQLIQAVWEASEHLIESVFTS